MKPRTAVAITVLLLLLGIIPFAVRAPDADQAAVPFENTKPTGLSDRVVSQMRDSTLAIPKAEAYYSQYRYVVGYYGITSLISGLQTQQRREFGRLLTVYVSDFSGTEVRVGADGYLRMPQSRTTAWIPAQDAYFVVNSSAKVPTRETALVPFSKRSDAVDFARQYGGTVKRWNAVKQLSVGQTGRTVQAWQTVVQRRTGRANQRAENAEKLLNRPVSVVVGQNASTIAGAIEKAPPNSTVVVPPGTYQVNELRIRKPLTLRGAGANATHIIGDNNGSVIVSTAAKTALSGMSITGVGADRSGDGDRVGNISVNKSSWKHRFYKVHGYGDAAIVFDSAASSFVSKVKVNTTSNGIIARTSQNVVVSNLTLYGTKRWDDGFLGVAAIGSRVIVQDSQVYGGKVGVYAYDAPRVVVRNTTMKGMMVGVFDLFSPKLTAVNNTVDDVWNGIYAETRSYGNAIVDNRVHNAQNGIIAEGRSNFVAQNTMVHNRKGMQVHGQYAVYWRNILAFNSIGAESGALLPLNQVTENDFIGNQRYVETQNWNVLHVWKGNYWTGTPGMNLDGDRYLERTFRPTGVVDKRLATTRGAPTLARSPAIKLIRQLQQLMPGLRAAGVVDPRPLAQPLHTEQAEQMTKRYNTTGQHRDADPWEYRQNAST